MSAWQLVNAFSGLTADFVSGTLAFAPKLQGDYRLFWSAGSAFGTLTREGDGLILAVLGGSLNAAEISVDGLTHRLAGRTSIAAGQSIELKTVA